MRINLEDAYGLKSLFENVFGKKAWCDLKHSTDLKRWKKYSIRLLEAIEFSAKSTVEVSDEGWFQELESNVEHGKVMINLAKDFEQLFANLAAALGRISFLQLGLIPSRPPHLNQVTLRHASDRKLNNYRSVMYVQNDEQKRALDSHNKSKQRTLNFPR